MPDSRQALSRALRVLAKGEISSVNDGAGNNAGNNNGGTTGVRRSGVVTGCWAQCAEHNVDGGSACTVGMFSQCTVMVVLLDGTSTAEHM